MVSSGDSDREVTKVSTSEVVPRSPTVKKAQAQTVRKAQARELLPSLQPSSAVSCSSSPLPNLPSTAELHIIAAAKHAEALVLKVSKGRQKEHTLHRPGSSSAGSSSAVGSSTLNQDEALLSWPSSFYMCNVIEGVKVCQKAMRGKRSDIFFNFFGVELRPSTLINFTHRWGAAFEDQRRAVVDTGQKKPEGTWEYFCHHIRDPQQDIRNAKRQDCKGKSKGKTTSSDQEDSPESY